MRAVCSQKQLPYTFKPKSGGDFVRESCGIIDLNSLSTIAIAITQKESEERNYCSMVFYRLEKKISALFYVIVWNTEAHLNVSDACYSHAHNFYSPT